MSRREVLAGMALLVAGFRGSLPALASNVAAPMSADEALSRLKQGNDHFVRLMTTTRSQSIAERTALGHGQSPFATILSCADSRTTPEVLFNAGLGDIFVVRVAGNVVTGTEQGSIEYSAAELKSPVVVVMGHSSCGAVKAAIARAKGEKFPGDIEEIADLIVPAAKATKGRPGDWVYNTTIENVQRSIKALRGSSVLSGMKSTTGLKIVGAYYELETGKVDFL
jgi:carbonic anhydrase